MKDDVTDETDETTERPEWLDRDGHPHEIFDPSHGWRVDQTPRIPSPDVYCPNDCAWEDTDEIHDLARQVDVGIEDQEVVLILRAECSCGWNDARVFTGVPHDEETDET